jgi:hypothetical protein
MLMIVNRYRARQDITGVSEEGDGPDLRIIGYTTLYYQENRPCFLDVKPVRLLMTTAVSVISVIPYYFAIVALVLPCAADWTSFGDADVINFIFY